MFAIVTIAGQQFKVRSGQEIFVHRLAGNVGDKVSFSEVLMTVGEGNIKAGSSLSASVEAEILYRAFTFFMCHCLLNAFKVTAVCDCN